MLTRVEFVGNEIGRVCALCVGDEMKKKDEINEYLKAWQRHPNDVPFISFWTWHVNQCEKSRLLDVI